MDAGKEPVPARLAWPLAVGALPPALLPGLLACALAAYAHRAQGRRQRFAAFCSLTIGAANLAGTVVAIWFVEAMLGVVLFLTLPCLAAGVMVEHRRRVRGYDDDALEGSEAPLTLP